ncbi:hypothetical protein CEQ90_09015 [Lewinellaceae bacterium SD302]|nr:hypothetical protein CEQ90_09015 [Lewinellaceae bacterium SD302]
MNILFVLEHYHPYIGGAETLFRDLTVRLAKLGHDITVVTTRFDNKLAKEENYRGVRVVRVNCRNRFLFSLLSLPRVWREAGKADLIHTTTYNAALPAWLAAKLRGERIIVTFHEVWAGLWKRLPFISNLAAAAYYLFEQLLLRLPFDRYVAVSDFTRRELIANGIPAEKVVNIYNGLDYAEFAEYDHQPPEQFTFTYYGRLGISKGLDLLLPAARDFFLLHPNSRLRLIIPRQPAGMYARVRELIEELEIEKQVELLHELPWRELLGKVATSSCVVIPSYSEGFCFVAAEAVALGVPIVSSGQGALVETVGGRFVEMEEMAVAALTQALERAFIKDYDYREPPSFPLADSIEAYLPLYGSIGMIE